MKTRNAFATLMLCLVLALTTATVVNVHEASAQAGVESRADCRRAVTGTYLYTASSGNVDLFRGILTLTQDGNVISTTSNQTTGAPPNSQPFGDLQGSYRCLSNRETTSTVLNFNYPTATLPGSITRSDTRSTFDPKAGTIQGTITGRTFPLNANPLVDDAPESGTFNFKGQRVEPRQ